MLLALFDRLHNTSGGVSETELNELMVNPTKPPLSSRVVMMVTPVANCDKAPRKCASLNPVSGVFSVELDIV